MEKIGFFEEKPGVRSSTRLFSFLLLLFLMVFDILCVLGKGADIILSMNFIIFNFILLIGVFAPKYLHKLAEISGIIKK